MGPTPPHPTMASHLLVRACFRNYQRFTAGAVAARHRPWCSSATNPLSDEAEEKTRSGGGESLMTARSNEEVRSMFEQWIVEYGKVYNTLSEKEKRFQIFKDALNLIEKTNAENLPYELGLNKFADLTKEEFVAQYTGLLSKNHPTGSEMRKQAAAVATVKGQQAIETDKT